MTAANSTNPTAAVVRVLRAADPSIYNATKRGPLAAGEAGVLKTLEIMREVAIDASRSNAVQIVARAITAGQPQKDFLAAVLALDKFIRSVVRFKKDTLGTETLIDPRQLLHEIGVNGFTSCDCDDVATLAAAIIRAMGQTPYFVLCADDAGHFVHVHYAVSINRNPRLVPFDPQERKKPGEWTAPPDRRKVVPA